MGFIPGININIRGIFRRRRSECERKWCDFSFFRTKAARCNKKKVNLLLVIKQK